MTTKIKGKQLRRAVVRKAARKAARNGKPAKKKVQQKRRVPSSKRSTKRMIATAKFVKDPEFQNLFPQLPNGEYNALKKSINEQGCLDAVKVWRDGDKDLLIDGYHRVAACDELTKEKKREVPYQIQLMDFDTRLDALLFVIDLHSGRRHLTPKQVSFYRGEKYNSLKAKHGGKARFSASPQNDDLQKTAEKVASADGVSKATVERDAKFAADVKAVAEKAGPEAKAAILDGKLSATREEVKALAEAPAETAKAAVEKVKSGEAKSVTEALPKKHRPKNTDLRTKAEKADAAAKKKAERNGSEEAEPWRNKSHAVEDRMKAWNKHLDSICREMCAVAEKLTAYGPMSSTQVQAIYAETKSVCGMIRTAKLAEPCNQCKGEGCGHCNRCGALIKRQADKA